MMGVTRNHIIRSSPRKRGPRATILDSRLRGNERSKVDRRAVLAGLGVTLLAPFAHAATAPISHKVGAIEVMVVSDGVLNVPLSFTLPENTPAEAAALFKAHGLPEQGAPAQTNAVLVKTGNELVLIDAGSGPNFQPTAGKLLENLEAAGIAPEKITKVVFTHAHADHLWGAIDDFGDGDRFPNASYVMAAPEWDFWTRSTDGGEDAGLAQGHGARHARASLARLKARSNAAGPAIGSRRV